MARISVDLPALGRPSSPTSASSFSSSFRCRASPGVPLVVLRGARLVELLKRVLPRPPRPPSATFSRAPSSARSPSTSPVSTSATMVPTGTLTVRSSPERPVLFRPAPPSPLSARNLRCTRKSASVLMPWSACSQTLPPCPPSPPSGPPRGIYFSRRKLRQPWPPLPACTRMVASSTNFIETSAGDKKTPPRRGFLSGTEYRHRPRGHGSGPGDQASTTLTYLRPCGPFFSNRTLPSDLANSVWSRPTPTLVPAWKRVPRWRTRMLPATTDWPPKSFTPSRLDSESRPFLLLPPAFLCAIVVYLLVRWRRAAAHVITRYSSLPVASFPAAAFFAAVFFAVFFFAAVVLAAVFLVAVFLVAVFLAAVFFGGASAFSAGAAVIPAPLMPVISTSVKA